MNIVKSRSCKYKFRYHLKLYSRSRQNFKMCFTLSHAKFYSLFFPILFSLENAPTARDTLFQISSPYNSIHIELNNSFIVKL